MSKEERILDLIGRKGEPMTARDITDALYGKEKQQGIVFGKLQEMVRKGLLTKVGASQPFGYELCSHSQESIPNPAAEAEESVPAVPVTSTAQPTSAVGMALHEFFVIASENNIEMYNEFSFQHELGIFLRNKFPSYNVQFERNVSFFFANARTVKKEMDIVLYDSKKGERYAIELKMPTNGEYPEQMYKFVEDIRFMEQLRILGFTRTYAVTLAVHRLFFEGKTVSGIYQYFRARCPLCGTVRKPTGGTLESITLQGSYSIDWKALGDSKKYYVVEL
jgi:hypothetical protein